MLKTPGQRIRSGLAFRSASMSDMGTTRAGSKTALVRSPGLTMNEPSENFANKFKTHDYSSSQKILNGLGRCLVWTNRPCS